MFHKVARFVATRGWYEFAVELLTRSRTAVRSVFLARVFGAKGLSIGPRSYIRGAKFIRFETGVHAGDGFWLEAVSRIYDQHFSPQILIGSNVSFGHWTHIAATNYVEIGANALIGSKVHITDHNHGQYGGDLQSDPNEIPLLRRIDGDKRTIVGANVWLGDGVVVCPGVTIGEGCVIGANSVVTRSIPPRTVAYGAPALPRKTFDLELRQWISVDNSREYASIPEVT
jgi:lipopolysaccharide O-acetyltransferase